MTRHFFPGCFHESTTCKCVCECHGLTWQQVLDEYRAAQEAADMGWP